MRYLCALKCQVCSGFAFNQIIKPKPILHTYWQNNKTKRNPAVSSTCHYCAFFSFHRHTHNITVLFWFLWPKFLPSFYGKSNVNSVRMHSSMTGYLVAMSASYSLWPYLAHFFQHKNIPLC